MKRVLLAWLLAFAASLHAAAESAAVDEWRQFDEANRRFVEARSRDDFLAVASLYRAMLDRGVESGVVYFNLGNAYVRAGEFGRAIAAYRQAERYRAPDPVLESNLDYALTQVGASSRPKDVFDHIVFWRRWLTYPTTGRAIVVGSALAFLFFLLGLLHSRRWRAPGFVALVVVLLLGVSFMLDYVEYERTRHGVVVVDVAVARKGNAESFAEAFNEPLKEGAEFRVLEECGDWVRVEVGKGLDGWLERDDVVVY